MNKEYWSDWFGKLGIAIRTISKALIEYYKAKDVLFGSLRGDIKHFHFHLIPLHEDEEKKWRLETLYENGHLFEFLGNLEKGGDTLVLKQRIQEGWDKDKQRKFIINQKEFKSEVKELRVITDYQHNR